VFVGREAERDRLRGRLARVAAYGEMMGPLTIVTGPRGVGKTSLLRDVADRAAADAGVFLNAVQNMAAEKDGFPLGVIGAGLPQTKAWLTQAATFGERTHEITLGKLDERDSRALLTEPARLAGAAWSGDALTLALARGDGYPQSLQIIGSAVWDAAAPQAGAEIAPRHVEAAEQAIQEDLESMFRARWEASSAAERLFLAAMAWHGTEPVPRAAVASRLGVPSDSLGVARRALIAKGVVEAARHGELKFTVPGFGAFVRSQRADPSDP
jgi:hypothetical protein